MDTAHGSLKAAFLDRDGVLNDLVDRGPDYRIDGQPFRWTAPFRMSELKLRPDAADALSVMIGKGYALFLATNQPDVSGGRIDPVEFGWMMRVFRTMPFSGIYFCAHRPNAGCACRKPAPGMLLNAARRHRIDLARSFMIGDSESDIEAGRAAGAHTILVSSAPGAATRADRIAADVMEAACLLP
jgi:D-glycero-D-manno-heptose 1,7-bisphosphate phosphatase